MIVSEHGRREVTVKGLAIYNDKLKFPLESAHLNEYVAIHVDTGDYAVSKRRSDATRVLLNRHGADGRLVVIKIGSEPEYGLEGRLFQSSKSKGLTGQ